MNDELKMNLKSMNIGEGKKVQLKQIFPEVFSEGKIDFDRLKQLLGEDIETGKERYGMNWAGKSNCFKIIQDPGNGTLKPFIEESINFDDTENLFIEGDNLEVLKLLQKSYYGKVKMIYIDPPYNTGNEFIYPDNFSENLDTYLKYTGQKDAEGRAFSTNLDTDGRYHSKWMNMMYPRLYLARNLLKDDGIIFISIDDHEIANLRNICDEIFGAENLIATICHKSRASISNDKIISENHNFILLYAKDIKEIFEKRFEFGIEPNLEGFEKEDSKGKYKLTPVDGPGGSKKGNPHYEFKGITGYWRYSKVKMQELFDQGLIVVTEKNLQKKTYFEEAKDKRSTVSTWWDDKLYTATATARLNKLMGSVFFDNPKPVELINKMIELHCRKSGDIILDFFAGSGTVAHSVFEMNKKDNLQRKFILVQLPEKISRDHDGFGKGFETISEVSIERIKRSLIEMGLTKEGFRVFKLAASNFKIWNTSHTQNIAESLKLFADHIDPNSKPEDFLYEILLKSGFELTTKVEKIQIEGNDIFSIENGTMFVYLGESINKELTYAIAEKSPSRFVCLDHSFHHNDQLKTNTVQLMKSRNIEFRTV